MGRLNKVDIKVIIDAYKGDLRDTEKEREIAGKLEHHAQCVVCTREIKLIKGFISDLSKLIT